MWSNAFFSAGSVRGVAIRIHFSILPAVLVACLHPFVSGLVAGYCVLILAHELGHAAMVKAAGARVTGVDLAPVAGLCHFKGEVTPAWRAGIAWGGVLAQLPFFVGTLVVVKLYGFPQAGFLDGLAWAFVLEYAFMAFVNLIAVDPLDGFQAWKLFGHLQRQLKRRRSAAVDLPKLKLEDRELESDEMPEEIRQTVQALLRDAAREARRPPPSTPRA